MADQAEALRKLVYQQGFERAHASPRPRVWTITGPDGSDVTHVARLLRRGLDNEATAAMLIDPIDLDEIDSWGDEVEVALVDAGAYSERARHCLAASDEVICVCTPENDQITGAYAAIKQIVRDPRAPAVFLAIAGAASFEQGMDVWRRLQATCARFLGIEVAWLGALPDADRLNRDEASHSAAERLAVEAMSLRILGHRRLEKASQAGHRSPYRAEISN